MRIVLFSLALLLLFWSGAAALAESSTTEYEGPSKALVEANTEFALELHRVLASAGGNVVSSPLSISLASAMLYAGSAGETATEIASALHFDLPPETLHAEFRTLTRELQARVAHWAKLTFANGLWVDHRCALVAEYSDLLSKEYEAQVEAIDFGGSPAAASASINDWISTQTMGKLESVVSPEMFGDLTRAVLVNTLYFLGAWNHGFNPRATKEGAFHLSDDSTVQVPMMHRRGRHAYYEADSVQVVELEYQGSGLSMLVVLPAPGVPLADIESRLTLAMYSDWVDHLLKREVELTIPKFEVEHSVDLIPVLRGFGVRRAFEWGAAELTGICADPDLFVSHARHDVSLGITEEGTEAAATTVYVITLGAEAVGAGNEVPIFRADRPFMYFLRDKEQGTILFIGRTADPRSGEGRE